MAETTFIVKGGGEELDLFYKAEKYYNSITPKWYEFKDNNTFELTLRHPEKSDGFSIEDKKEYEIDDILKTLEKHRQRQYNKQKDYSNPQYKDEFWSAYADYVAKRDSEIIINSKKENDMENITPKQEQNTNMIGGTIREIAGKSLTDKDYLHLFDEGTKNAIEMYLKATPNAERIKLTPQDNLALAERWQQEINNPTEMSKGMTINQIAEKEANYHSLYNHGIKQKQTQNLQNMNTQSHNELEKKLQELGEKANKGSNPYESYLALKETAEEKGFTILLKNEKEFQKPRNYINPLADIYAEYYKEDKKLSMFSAMTTSDGKVGTFREEYTYDEFDREVDGRTYLKVRNNSSDIDSIKNNLVFAIARVNNQERVLKSDAEKAITDSNYLYTMNVAKRDRLIDFVKNTPDLQGKPLTSQDYLAISDAFSRESQRENKILETGMNSNQLSEKTSEYYNLYQEKEKQELKQTQNLNNMEAITPKEKVEELFNEIKETFSPIEKAFFQRKLANIDDIGAKELSDFLDHSGITPQEKEKVNSFFAETISPMEKQYSFIDWELLRKTEIDDDFRKEVNPIFLDVVTKRERHNEPKKEFDITEHLNNQMKYLGFGDNHKEEIQKGIDSNDKSFQIKTTSDRVMEGNQVDFAVNFNKSEGGVFLNSFNARLITQDGEERSHNFKLNFTAKEAINLLEGRAVKTEFTNSKTNEPFESFVKLKFNEPKNEYNNYKLEFHKANEIDTAKIVELSGLKFEKPEYKDFVVKSLEKGNITNVKFTHEGNEIEGKAILNTQYKNLNLYDKDMNRVNTNKPLQGLEQDNNHEKSKARQQNISRSI